MCTLLPVESGESSFGSFEECGLTPELSCKEFK